jgi:hypothetical protein
VLPDGRVLLGNLDDTRTAIFDPATDTFSAGPAKPVSSSEESWVLLPDETVITVRCDNSRKADKYLAAANTWVDGGTLPTGIIEVTSSEIGAGVLVNDGRAFFAGANGHGRGPRLGLEGLRRGRDGGGPHALQQVADLLDLANVRDDQLLAASTQVAQPAPSLIDRFGHVAAA